MIVFLHTRLLYQIIKNIIEIDVSPRIHFISTKNFKVRLIRYAQNAKNECNKESIINFINKSVEYLLNNKLKYRRYVELNHQ